MPRLPQARLDARREQILNAACVCFSRKGVHATTISDICEEADLSTGAVYGHFENKEDIIRAAADASRERLERVIALARAEPVARQGLGRLLDSLAACADSRSEGSLRAARLEVGLWAGALSSSHLQGLILNWYDVVIPAIAELVARLREEEGLPSEPSAEVVARMAVAAIQGMQLQRAMREGDAERIHLAAVLHAWID